MNYWLWRFYVKRPDGQKVLVASHIAGMSPEIVKSDLEAGNSFLRSQWEKTFSAPRDPAAYLELDAARGQTSCAEPGTLPKHLSLQEPRTPSVNGA